MLLLILKSIKIIRAHKNQPINQLMIGQLNTSVPVFSGFKIQNSIKVYENLYEAEIATTTQTKEDIALRVIDYYASCTKLKKLNC
jgi:outer membrane protein TolC